MVREYLEREFAAARRGRNVAIVMFGLPDLDSIGDARGPNAVDEMVVAFGAVLERMTRRMNLSARCGWRSEAFLSVLSEADVRAARAFVRRVQEAAAQLPVPLPRFYAGIAVFQPHMRTPEELIAAAESALAQAVAEGERGHNWVGFSSSP